MAWLSGWSQRQALTINNFAAEVQVLLDLSTINWDAVASDGADIRVTDNDGTTLLPIWLQEFDYGMQTGKLWIKLPATYSGNLYLYSGNSEATSVSSYSDTFGLSFAKTIDIGTSLNIYEALFSPSKTTHPEWLAIALNADYTYDFKIWDVDENTLVQSVPTPGNRGRGHDFSPDCSLYAVGGGGSASYAWVYNTSTWSKTDLGYPGRYDAYPRFKPDGSQLIFVWDYHRYAKLYSVPNLSLITTITLYKGRWSPNGNYFATGRSNVITVRETTNWSTLFTPTVNNVNGVVGVDFSPDNSLLAIANIGVSAGEGEIRVYRTSDWSSVANIPAPANRRWAALRFSRKGTFLIAITTDQVYAYIISTSDWSILETVNLNGSVCGGLSFRADLDQIAFVADDLVKIYQGLEKVADPEPSLTAGVVEEEETTHPVSIQDTGLASEEIDIIEIAQKIVQDAGFGAEQIGIFGEIPIKDEGLGRDSVTILERFLKLVQDSGLGMDSVSMLEKPPGFYLDIYRGMTLQTSVRVDETARLIRKLLGEDIIKATIKVRDILDIAIGDYIIYGGVNYYINSLPNIRKDATNQYEYEITFESEYYELTKTQFLDLDGNSDFDLVGNLETFIDLIVTNMNRTHSGWARGTCNQTNQSYKLLSFSKENCMQVLQRLCEEFEGEYYFDGKNICFTDKVGSETGLTFKYKQGLRNIVRQTLSEKNIVTRLYAFGSTKNLASDYRNHSRRLKFEVEGKSYLEKNTDKYGVIEHTEIFEDIYPHREGIISWVDPNNILKFRDSGMDFNLNDYLLPGVSAKVHFNSGDLGGYEFEVLSYNHTDKEFTIITFQDEQGYEMPNATLKPAVGDKYVLLDIKMPQSYIDAAEAALQAKAQEYLDDNCEPRVTYLLQPDWRYFKLHTIELNVGDFITIQDEDLGINTVTRIVEMTKSLSNPYKYTLKLSDHLEVQLIQRMYSEQEDLKKKIEIGEGGDIVRARRNWRTSEELRNMIFDTDGYFDMGNIRPLSIETGMLSVGAKSTQFILKEVQIEANYQSDPSKFHASAGSLIHLAIADEIRTWTLFENTQDSLADDTAYYIYAKCTKEPDYTGQIIVDETQRKVDDDPDYYYFLIGVLHSVVDGVRGISLTYGQSLINGKFITTGKIQSIDGLTYFDLDEGVLAGRAGIVAGLIKSQDEKMQLDLDDNVLTVKDINDYIRAKFGKLNGDYGMEIRDSQNDVMISTGEQLGLSQKYADRLVDYLVGTGYSTPPFVEASSEANPSDILNITTEGEEDHYLDDSALRIAQRITLSGYQISQVKFRVRRYGSPGGTLYARIRKVSDDSIIEQAPESYAANSESTSYHWITFTFSCAPNEEVRVSLELDGATGDWPSDVIYVAVNRGISFTGQLSKYFSGAWTDYASVDLRIQIIFQKFPKENTIDDSVATFWQPNPPYEEGAWITWDLGSTKMLDGCKIYWGSDAAYRPTEYKIYTSLDNSIWVEKVHETSAPPANDWKEYTWDRCDARYIKLAIITHGAEGTRVFEFKANIANKIWQIGVLAGTIAHGETIPLPAGFTEEECYWIVSVNYAYHEDDINGIQCSADGTRQVTVQIHDQWDGGWHAGTANYLIIGVK